MERAKEVQEYLSLSYKYLSSAKMALTSDLYEPALANAIHALELASKAALLAVVEDSLKTHNVGGLFAQYYKERVGPDTCRQLNRILNKYNIPRYPEEDAISKDEIKETLDFAERFLAIIKTLLKI